MARFKIATLIGSTSLDGAASEGTEVLATLARARPDLFGAQNEVIDFHLDRYVVLFASDSRRTVEDWAAANRIALHGAILGRADVHQLYVGWTGLIDAELGGQAA